MNQHPAQIARDKIDVLLQAAGWVVQSMQDVNLFAAQGVSFPSS